MILFPAKLESRVYFLIN